MSLPIGMPDFGFQNVLGVGVVSHEDTIFTVALVCRPSPEVPGVHGLVYSLQTMPRAHEPPKS